MPTIFYEGEDIPLVIEYQDSSGTNTDPDAAPTVDIIAPDDTEVVSAASMTSVSTGVYEYVWDSSTNASGTGEYEVVATADFGTETKISKVRPSLQ